MSGDSKFSSKRPKGDAWGVEDAIAHAAAEFRKTGRSPMIPFIGVMAVSKIEMSAGDDGPVYVAVVEIRRANSLDSDDAIRAGQKLLMKAIQERSHGAGADMLPVDEREIIMQAFGGVDSAEVEQDTKEAEEEATMPEPDKLRRHLTAVHGFPAEEVAGWEMFDVHKTHDALHTDLPAGTMPHDKEWWGWRRVVIAEKTAELHGEGIRWENDTTPDAEPAEMDDQEEITKHLTEVHDFDHSILEGETLSDLRQRHVNDHENPPDEGFPAHELGWLGHTKDDLDAAESQAEDDQTPADTEPAADKTED